MLVYDLYTIGNRLYELRKRMGMTQLELAVAADISERTYADIERGTTNMRLETLLRICEALYITPDKILTSEDSAIDIQQSQLLDRLNACSQKEKQVALQLLSVYLSSLE